MNLFYYKISIILLILEIDYDFIERDTSFLMMLYYYHLTIIIIDDEMNDCDDYNYCY